MYKLSFIYKLFQQCYDFRCIVPSLSLDWETYPNLNTFIKLFTYYKEDICCVLVTNSGSISSKLLLEKTTPLHDKVLENLNKVECVENGSDGDNGNL